MGALLGDDVVEAGPGDLVYKPRGQWHTFWNAGDEPARILEIISPAGFEQFFAELARLRRAARADPEALGELCARYALDMQPDSVPELLERFGLVIGERLWRRRRRPKIAAIPPPTTKPATTAPRSPGAVAVDLRAPVGDRDDLAAQRHQ